MEEYRSELRQRTAQGVEPMTKIDITKIEADGNLPHWLSPLGTAQAKMHQRQQKYRQAWLAKKMAKAEAKDRKASDTHD